MNHGTNVTNWGFLIPVEQCEPADFLLPTLDQSSRHAWTALHLSLCERQSVGLRYPSQPFLS